MTDVTNHFAIWPTEIQEYLLARDITLAKVWNIVEFLSQAHTGNVADTSGITRLIPALPDWLQQVAAVIDA